MHVLHARAVFYPAFEPLEYGLSSTQKWDFLRRTFNLPKTLHVHQKVRPGLSVSLSVDGTDQVCS